MSNTKVWKRFEVTQKDGSVLKLSIQDARPDQRDGIIEFLQKYFLGEETLQKASGIHKSVAAKEEYGRFWEQILVDGHVVVCCEDEGAAGAAGAAGPLVGVSSMILETKDKKRDLDLIISQAKAPEVKKLLEVVRVISEWCDGFRELGVDKYYAGRGITVHPGYRQLGIAREFVSNRRQICREHKVPATGALMTATGTQVAALGDGWRVLREVPFDELGRMCGVVFDGPPLCKYMVAEEHV